MTTANPPTTPIATSKSAALSRVLDLVPKGYTYYVAGRIPFRKLPRLLAKFHSRYGIGCSPAQRITRKAKGQSNAALVVYCPPAPVSGRASESPPDETRGREPTIATASPGERREDPEPGISPGSSALGLAMADWLLLVTPGGGSVWDEENLASVLTQRLAWLGYELVRHPVRGRTAWTWRRPKAAMAELRTLLEDQLNRWHMAVVSETLVRIARQPGFAGVRRQSWNLCQYARANGYRGELPTLWHMQRVSHGIRVVIEGISPMEEGRP